MAEDLACLAAELDIRYDGMSTSMWYDVFGLQIVVQWRLDHESTYCICDDVQVLFEYFLILNSSQVT